MLKRSLITLTLLCLFTLTNVNYAIPVPPIGPIGTDKAFLIGTNAQDRVGGGFVIEGGLLSGRMAGIGRVVHLPNGNIVVASPQWNEGRGAVTCLTPAEYTAVGTPIEISAANSLIGAAAGDYVGMKVDVLMNGNYVVSSAYWDNGGVADVGAVTWVNGQTCIPKNESGRGALVSPSNSLIGSQTTDIVGIGTVALPNGNYITYTGIWDNGATPDVGAITWANGLTGLVGVVSPANSLVGGSANDGLPYNAGTLHGLGPNIKILANGNVVIGLPRWDNPQTTATDAGAVIWMNSALGRVGTIGAANALIGSNVDDFVGYNIMPLTNGNYVVINPFWGNQNLGAITWANGKTGLAGVVSSSNSIVGSTSQDGLGWGDNRNFALDNGSYVISTPNWDNGAIANAGAVFWSDGTTPISGTLSAANALVGTSTDDLVGTEVRPLVGGGFVVASPNWNNGATADVGAVTWASGTSPIKGTISAANSLIGSAIGDAVGGGGITALSNGHYVVTSRFWDNPVGSILNVGAVTWGNKNGSTVGVVSAANSMIGQAANDQIGYGLEKPVALTNGNYVILSPDWNGKLGAITWVDGSGAASGVVTAANSLTGSSYEDIKNGSGSLQGAVTALPNGNYVVSLPAWNNEALTDAGAVVWGDGAIGTSGVINSTNALVGSIINGEVGRIKPFVLANGNYLVQSPNNVGAMTWCDAQVACVGEITESNSLIGEQPANFGAVQTVGYPNGDYLLLITNWGNSAGAIVHGDGTRPITGVLNTATALYGTTSGDMSNATNTILPDYGVIVSVPLWDNGATQNVGALIYLDAPVNRLQNPSYETAGSAAKFASNWKLNAGAAAGDKRLCTKPAKPITRTAGACVFQFNSTSTPLKARTLKQAIPNPAWANIGDVLTLTADVEGVKVGTGAKKIILNVKYDNNTTDKATLTIPAGTYDFQTLVGTVKLTRAVKTITVTVNVGKAKGRIRIDNLTLRDSSPAALRFPMLGESTTRDGASPFGLPAAPEGFRK